jgi:hypothetical protein
MTIWRQDRIWVSCQMPFFCIREPKTQGCDHRTPAARMLDGAYCLKRTRYSIPQRVCLVDGQLSVPKVGLVRLVLHRPVEGVMKRATFRQDAAGAWYVPCWCISSCPT